MINCSLILAAPCIVYIAIKHSVPDDTRLMSRLLGARLLQYYSDVWLRWHNLGPGYVEPKITLRATTLRSAAAGCVVHGNVQQQQQQQQPDAASQCQPAWARLSIDPVISGQHKPLSVCLSGRVKCDANRSRVAKVLTYNQST